MSAPRIFRPLDALPPLLALALLFPVLWQYQRPVQDRDFGSLGGGSADFINYYLGSLAFSAGFDPYLNGREEFRDPFGREIVMDGVIVTHYYLPGHYVVYAPLTWIFGSDWERAAQVYYWLHLALLSFLAWLTARVACAEQGARPALGRNRITHLWGAVLILYGLHVGVRLGLERGQSDVIQSILFWGGVACVARGHIALAAFLIVIGTSMKGYGIVLLCGLGLSQLGRPRFRNFLAGVLAAGLPILALTWAYWDTGLRVARYRADDFSFHWTIHSFRHVGYAISPGLADPARNALTLAGLVAAVLWWWRYRDVRGGQTGDSTSRLVPAALVSIATMLGFGSASEVYNLILLLPGLVWLAVLMYRDPTPVSLPREALFSAAFLLISLRTPFRLFSPAAYGLVLLIAAALLPLRTSPRSELGPGRGSAS